LHSGNYERFAADRVEHDKRMRRLTLEEVGRITAEQMAELARFVDQCNPDFLQQVLSMLAQGACPAVGWSGALASTPSTIESPLHTEMPSPVRPPRPYGTHIWGAQGFPQGVLSRGSGQ